LYFYEKNLNSNINKLTEIFVFSRTFIGIGLIISFTIMSLFLPRNMADYINPDAYLRRYSIDYLSKSTGVNVGEILSGKNIVQVVTARANGFTAIAVQLANYQRKPSGYILFKLRNNAGVLVAESKIEASKIRDNHLYKFKFPSIADSQGQSYRLEIISEGAAPGAALTAWLDTSAKSGNVGELTVGGALQAGCLVMNFYYDPAAK